jgi:hypothetical protein
VAREFEVASEIRQLLYLRWEYRRLGDVLFAAADAVAGFGEETALSRF